MTLKTYEAISALERCRLYTHLQIREDAWVLYGFATETERGAFQKLLSVSGVGAATSRILLSSLSSVELAQVVESGDTKALERVKGIGSKTAQRIILELKGKLIGAEGKDFAFLQHNTVEADTLNALLGLGIGKSAAEEAIKKIKPTLGIDAGVEEWIKAALRSL